MVKCLCGKPAVFILDQPFCKEHFEDWLKVSVMSELDKYVGSDDVLAVAVSGGKDSTTLLDIVNSWGKSRPVAICIDEGIKGYRDKSLNFLKKFCRENDIELKVVSFEKQMGKTLDSFLKIRDQKGLDLKACTICGTFRRYLLNQAARELGATKILFAHNKDDELQTLLMNLSTGNLNQISTKGELGGLVDEPLFVVRFKPLMDVSEKALATYAVLNYPTLPGEECPNLRESVRYKSRIALNRVESTNPGSKDNLMTVYKETILPAARKSVSSSRKIIKCSVCGEPTSNWVCKACEIKRKLLN